MVANYPANRLMQAKSVVPTSVQDFHQLVESGTNGLQPSSFMFPLLGTQPVTHISRTIQLLGLNLRRFSRMQFQAEDGLEAFQPSTYHLALLPRRRSQRNELTVCEWFRQIIGVT
ncbi:hypothetical protein PSYJA_11525 [Pseudomonas syringae pv. japonica str. M301072]|uniref:Uncharacterized protein n=1 Tax=Pseudomonas syringae pv. japonica str. M301072 TaxID=629262 RepID=F3FH79_PSESX|nr:hypothetical protein PSYJA_11525 [Pseudomonas syringae pv. japonica str. M301072]